jgi:hypothetical protein
MVLREGFVGSGSLLQLFYMLWPPYTEAPLELKKRVQMTRALWICNLPDLNPTPIRKNI